MISRVVVILMVAVFSLQANAWMDQWAPEFDCKTAKVRVLPKSSVSNFYEKAKIEIGCAEYASGGSLDLNGDGRADSVYIVPWMGCGLNADGYEVYFYVSNGKGGVTESVIDGYGVELSDLVIVKGKTYFRQSKFFESFEKSQHNHWVYQLYSFDTNGIMRCANADFGKKFPAVTIFYIKPKFRQIELTPADLKAIQKESAPVVNK